MMEKAGIDRLTVLNHSIETVRRGVTLSLIGVYAGWTDPIDMDTLFDKEVQVRMGQASVRRWVEDPLPLLQGDSDPLGVEDLATHQLPLSDAPGAYEKFQKKEDGAIKVVLKP